MNRRRTQRAGAVAILAALSACQNPSTTQPQGQQTRPVTGPLTALSPFDPSLATPPGLPSETLAPRTGAALDRAKMSLEQALATMPVPASIASVTQPKPTTAPATAPATSAEPPLPAQQAYARGRQALKQAQSFEAIRQFEQALTIAPDNAALLRQLGQLYLGSGNRVRAAALLERAVAADPTDPQTLMILGRVSFDQSQWPQAAHLLAAALRNNIASVEPGLDRLTQYYLGGALERQGFDAAAIAQFKLFLESANNGSWSAQRMRDLATIQRQRGVLWVMIGDLNNRLGQPSLAWDAYANGIEQGVTDNQEMQARKVYTLLQLGRSDEAQQLVLERLSAADNDNASLDLVTYVAKSGPRPRKLIEKLEQVYNQSDHSARLALALASLQGAPKGPSLLRAHLLIKPEDRVVYDALVKQTVPDATATELAQTLLATDKVMSAAPQNAIALATSLVDTANPATLDEAMTKLSAADRARPMVRMIQAASLTKAQKLDEAMTELDAAVTSAPQMVQPRLMLARLAIAQQDIDRADKALAPIASSNDPEIVTLWVRVLASTKRNAEALLLLDNLIKQQPENVDLVLSKAGLQAGQGDGTGAEQTLLDALNAKPEQERLYEALFELYDSRVAPPNAVQGYQRLMRRVLQKLPNSRICRLKRAELASAGSDFAQAETLLRGLLNENPRDYAAMDLLLDTLFRSGRTAEADAFINDRMDKAPQDRNILRLGLVHFRTRANDRARAGAIEEKMVNLMPVGPERDAALALVYLRQNDPAKALASVTHGLEQPQLKDPKELLGLLGPCLARAGQAERIDTIYPGIMRRFPDQAADIQYEWAMAWELAGNKQRSEEVLVKNVKEFPTHAPSNNGLGYNWADQGRNLDQAKRMIEAALKVEPNRQEYLDSLGWVYYKLGKFPEAVNYLGQALGSRNDAHPVILDHLGDAFYRLGKVEEAKRNWALALEILAQRKRNAADSDQTFESQELVELEKVLPGKLQAMTNNQKPKVAPLAPGVNDVVAPNAAPAGLVVPPGPAIAPGIAPGPRPAPR